jgi:hypothetical protein
MQEDRDRFAFELSNVIPDEVMDQAFDLLGVTREEVVKQLGTETARAETLSVHS